MVWLILDILLYIVCWIDIFIYTLSYSFWWFIFLVAPFVYHMLYVELLKMKSEAALKLTHFEKIYMNFYFIQSSEHFDKKIILLNCIATFHCHFSFNKKCVKYFLNSLHTKATTIFKHNCSLCIQFMSPLLLAF